MTESTELTDGLIITKKFRTATEFSLYIENRVLETKSGYMDSVIAYCAETDINIESIGKLITSSLKEKIRAEAEEQNFMKPRGGKLPL
jgi:hypothetical protein